MRLLLLALGVMIGPALLGSNCVAADEPPKPDLKPLFAEVKKLVTKHYPDAKVTLDEQTIVFSYNTRKFMIHEPLLTGEWQDAFEEIGPQKGGIVGTLELRAGRYGGQAVVPQSFDKRYFVLFVTAIYSKRLDHHLYVHLKFPRDTSKEFLTAFDKLTEGFDKLEEQAPAVKEPELRAELLKRVETDQKARTAFIEWMQKHAGKGPLKPADLDPERKAEYDRITGAMMRVDKENTARLREIIAKLGWPTVSLVGKDGAHSAWLLVQHADADPRFQRECLDRMTKLPKDEVSQKDVAYLTDRVLLAEGKKQLYGTQFTSENGKWVPRPLEDPENVDRRRTEAGLSTLAEYVKQLEAVYGGPAKK